VAPMTASREMIGRLLMDPLNNVWLSTVPPRQRTEEMVRALRVCRAGLSRASRPWG
jgi:hypothetical protein